MALETLGKTNIKDLVLPPSKKEALTWDFATKVTNTDWRRLLEELEAVRGFTDDFKWRSFATLAHPMKVLFPERVDELKLNDTAFGGIIDHVNFLAEQDKWTEFGEVAFKLISLNANKTRDYLPKEAWERLTFALKRTRNTDTFSFGLLAANVAGIYPDRKDGLDLNDQAWEKISQEITSIGDNNGLGYSRFAAAARLTFPDRYLELGLDNQRWEQLGKQFDFTGKVMELEARGGPNIYRSGHFNYANFAMNLKILSAEKAVLNNQGIELVMPSGQQFKQPALPIPTQRRF